MRWGNVAAAGGGGGGGGGGEPELLPNTTFADATNVTLSGGAAITGGVLDLGAAMFGAGKQSFTRENVLNEVFALNVTLTRLGDCSLVATFGYGGGSQYGSQSITASGEYLFTYTDGTATASWDVQLYNSAGGTVSPQIDTVSFKKKP